MHKVLFVATVARNHIAKFHIPYLQMFKEEQWETAVAARNDYDDNSACKISYCDQYYDLPFSRSPFSFGNISAYKKLKKIIENNDYKIIHCHTPVGGLVTRLAARRARKKGTRVIYTAHGFHFYKGAPLVNWILYYPVEYLMSYFTDVLITINEEDFKRAKTFKAKRVCYVPGVGIDKKKFKCDNPKKVRESLRMEFDIPMDATVLLSVGDLNKNKNHKVVIEALSKINKNDLYYVICGNGPLFNYYLELAEKLNVKERVILTGFRFDVDCFYKMADIFVFPSFREGLPVSVMEAMMCGMPVVATNIRGTKDLLKYDKEELLSPKDVDGFVKTINNYILTNKVYELGEMNKFHAKNFCIEKVIEEYKKIYFCK